MKRLVIAVTILAVVVGAYAAGRRWKYPWIDRARIRQAHRPKSMLQIEVHCLSQNYKYEVVAVGGLQVLEMIGTPSPGHLHVRVKIQSEDGRLFGAEKEDSQKRAEAFFKALVPEVERRFCKVGAKQKYLRMQVRDGDVVAFAYSLGKIRMGTAMAKPTGPEN